MLSRPSVARWDMCWKTSHVKDPVARVMTSVWLESYGSQLGSAARHFSSTDIQKKCSQERENVWKWRCVEWLYSTDVAARCDTVNYFVYVDHSTTHSRRLSFETRKRVPSPPVTERFTKQLKYRIDLSEIKYSDISHKGSYDTVPQLQTESRRSQSGWPWGVEYFPQSLCFSFHVTRYSKEIRSNTQVL